MKANVKEIENLIKENFNGNKSAFAKIIGVDRTQVSKIIHTGTGAGAQFFGGLMAYCKNTNLDFCKYIFLPNNVNKINDKVNSA